MSGHMFGRWIRESTSTVGRHSLVLLCEEPGSRSETLEALRKLVGGHYVDPQVAEKRLASLGAPKTAELLSEHLPVTKTARSGDIGEVLATEVAEQQLHYRVPIRRLRWKDGRNMPLRGDDIIGLSRDKRQRLVFLKGESKSRAAVSSTAIVDASKALEDERGRPTRHSVLFVADRLRDLGEDDLAKELEEAVLRSFRGTKIEHMLFVLAGNDPEGLLRAHLVAKREQRHVRYAVGFRIHGHGQFVEELFEGLMIDG